MPKSSAHSPIDHVLRTGLRHCYSERGEELDCDASAAAGQDAALKRGLPWPTLRFSLQGQGLVSDELTGLLWSQNANLTGFPCTWSEALDQVRQLNAEAFLGHEDWRLPNRRELRSLISHGARRPSLPEQHPFRNVFQGWYWSSTSSARAPAYAWYVHLAGGRMFYGAKSGDCMLWPVCGASEVIPQTGQRRCLDAKGQELPHQSPLATVQDGAPNALEAGAHWPEPRFEVLEASDDDLVLDRLTSIVWRRDSAAQGLLTWQQALDMADELSQREGLPWRLPNINELESLADASQHSPALPHKHPFANLQQAYWSSSTSFFEPDWSYCFYLDKGAVGVGHKPAPEFYAWYALDKAQTQA